MTKVVIGFICMFFIILPFFLINIKIIKIKDKGKFIRAFLVLLFLMIAVVTVVCRSLYLIGVKILIGGLILFIAYIVLITIHFFSHVRHAKEKEEHFDIDNNFSGNEMDIDSEL